MISFRIQKADVYLDDSIPITIYFMMYPLCLQMPRDSMTLYWKNEVNQQYAT